MTITTRPGTFEFPAEPAGITVRARSAFAALVTKIAASSRGAACVRTATRLSALSDQQLAARKLDREDIVPYSFNVCGYYR